MSTELLGLSLILQLCLGQVGFPVLSFGVDSFDFQLGPGWGCG